MPDPTPPPKSGAAPAAPAPPPQPAAAPEPTAAQKHSAMVGYDELETMDAAPAKEAAKQSPPSKTPASSTAPAAAKSEPGDGSGGKPAQSASPASTPPEPGKEPAPVKAAELRAAYENLKKEHQTLKAEHEKVKTAKPSEDPERKTILETLDAREKRIKELEQELSFTSYERSQDYKDKYEKPFVDAYNAGRGRVAALKIVERKNDMDEVTQESRPAVQADFDKIMSVGDDDEAAAMADQMFGNKASMVLWHRERVQELNRARYAAIEEHKKGAEEREKTAVATRAKQEEESKAMQSKMVELFNKNSTEAVEKYPEFFKPIEGDEKGNTILENSRKFADMVFKPSERYAPEQQAAMHAAAYNKIMGFDRLAYMLRNERAKTKELESKLAEFTASEGAGGTTRRAADASEKSFDSELDELDKMG